MPGLWVPNPKSTTHVLPLDLIITKEKDGITGLGRVEAAGQAARDAAAYKFSSPWPPCRCPAAPTTSTSAPLALYIAQRNPIRLNIRRVSHNREMSRPYDGGEAHRRLQECKAMYMRKH